MNGRATIEAAKLLLEAMKKDDGTYRTYDEMVAEGIETKYLGSHTNSTIENLAPMDPNTGIGSPSVSYTYALYMAEVEVDTKTGKTTVMHYTCVDDVGVIGNIQAMEGQAYGGISHSIGFALSEDYRDVRTQNNIYTCGIPYIKDIPDDIKLVHCQNPRDVGPFGSSGASEAFQSAGHMAVINAINNATGVRIYQLPATPEKVKAGLDILEKGGKTDPPGKWYLGPDFHERLEDILNDPK
jgi:aldehyde oxidoreductase